MKCTNTITHSLPLILHLIFFFHHTVAVPRQTKKVNEGRNHTADKNNVSYGSQKHVALLFSF